MLKESIVGKDEIDINELFVLLSDAEEADDVDLPNTGVSIELERKLSPLFIKTPDYGTRSATVLIVDKNNHATFVERTYKNGEFLKENRFVFQIDC